MWNNKQEFSSFPAVKKSFYSLFPGTMAAGGVPFQQEDNASWKCHVRVAVNRSGNVGQMMTGGRVMIQEVPSWRGSQNIWSHIVVICILQYCVKNSHFMLLTCQFCLDEGSCCGFGGITYKTKTDDPSHWPCPHPLWKQISIQTLRALFS